MPIPPGQEARILRGAIDRLLCRLRQLPGMAFASAYQTIRAGEIDGRLRCGFRSRSEMLIDLLWLTEADADLDAKQAAPEGIALLARCQIVSKMFSK